MKTSLPPRRPFSALLLFGLCFGGPCPIGLVPMAEAAPSPDKRMIQKLKKQNRGLKRTVATLKKQLVEARRALPSPTSPTSPNPPEPAPFLAMVPVGNAGNAADSTAYGAVPYDFRIGRHEVTLAQYAAFLNAVAKADTYALYDTRLATDLNIAGISRSGSPGSYAYSVIGAGTRPVTYVSWFDAARFCNWLHNGRPTGAQDATTTERGAYTLDGATSGTGYGRVWAAKYWIPSEDEWYKAAYHHPAGLGGDGDSYWLYPTRSNALPGNTIGGLPLANQANFLTSVFSVTSSGSYDLGQNYLAPTGSYPGSASFYGTLDQGGNVAEWNDAVIGGTKRGLRGGSWSDFGGTDLSSSSRSEAQPNLRFSVNGFRVASP